MSFIYNLLVFILLVLTFGMQEFIPPIEFAQQARVLLPPVFFFSSALSVPFPVMLCFALFTGLVWDARHLPYKPDKVNAAPATELVSNDLSERFSSHGGDLPFGYSTFLLGVMGTLMQGIRPLFKRGRWEVPVIMVGLAIFAWLLIEYLIMSFLRGSFVFPPGMWTKMITQALLAMLVSPVILFILHTFARTLHYEVRQEGLTYRFYGN
jgi:hypothetical protein